MSARSNNRALAELRRQEQAREALGQAIRPEPEPAVRKALWRVAVETWRVVRVHGPIRSIAIIKASLRRSR